MSCYHLSDRRENSWKWLEKGRVLSFSSKQAYYRSMLCPVHFQDEKGLTLTIQRVPRLQFLVLGAISTRTLSLVADSEIGVVARARTYRLVALVLPRCDKLANITF